MLLYFSHEALTFQEKDNTDNRSRTSSESHEDKTVGGREVKEKDGSGRPQSGGSGSGNYAFSRQFQKNVPPRFQKQLQQQQQAEIIRQKQQQQQLMRQHSGPGPSNQYSSAPPPMDLRWSNVQPVPAPGPPRGPNSYVGPMQGELFNLLINF